MTYDYAEATIAALSRRYGIEPALLRDLYDERAAIREHDGQQQRRAAETAALADLRTWCEHEAQQRLQREAGLAN